MRRVVMVGAMMVAVLGMLPGCVSNLTGNEGNFVFSYWADDNVTDFNKPVAVGARLDLEVREVGTNQPVELSSAAYDDPAVLDVVEFEGHQVTVEGTGDGLALLSVEGTTAGGELLPDSVNMIAAVPDVLVLWHSCTLGDTAHVLTDQRVWVPFEMERTNGQPVIGYGYYPVTLSSAAATLDVDESGQQWMALDTASAAGALQLTSDLDATTLNIDVVAPGDIDGIAEPIAYVLEDIDVGDVNGFYVLPTSGGVTICQAIADMTVQSDTPAICDVRERDPEEDGSDAAKEYGWFEIEGVAEGTCEYTVTYPDGAGGAGQSAQFTYPIEP